MFYIVATTHGGEEFFLADQIVHEDVFLTTRIAWAVKYVDENDAVEDIGILCDRFGKQIKDKVEQFEVKSLLKSQNGERRIYRIDGENVHI